MSAPAEVVSYDERWPGWFDEIRVVVVALLGGLDAEVEHVGSTAVPGLAAKPIIDVDVVVRSADDLPAAIAALERGGYRHEGDLGITGREAFGLPANAARYHHLYLVVEGNKAHQDHVVLRDLLRADPAARVRYAARKRELAHLLATDRAAYGSGKADLISELLEGVARLE